MPWRLRNSGDLLKVFGDFPTLKGSPAGRGLQLLRDAQLACGHQGRSRDGLNSRSVTVIAACPFGESAMAGRPARDHLLAPATVRVLTSSLWLGPNLGHMAKQRYPGIAAHLRGCGLRARTSKCRPGLATAADGPVSVCVTARVA
jgi:hypothetical protein